MLVRSRKARARRSRALSVLSSIIGVFFEAHVPEKYLDFHCILSGALVASLSNKRIKKEQLRLFFFYSSHERRLAVPLCFTYSFASVRAVCIRFSLSTKLFSQ
jgi:hypothetical protein